ncbi:MAG TPA: hypothetical protein VN034_06120 [Sphingopyxis sp.]|nr:hypothetical protein [Sphingopyxis sp.]
MERALIFGFGLFGFGLLFCWLALLGWRHRNDEQISMLEAGILKVTGEEPLPLTRLDRWIQRFQLVMMTIFGPLMALLGGYGLLSELDIL